MIKKIFYTAVIIVFISLLSTGCHKSKQNIPKGPDTVVIYDTQRVYIPTIPDSNAILVADSITYAVLIKNPNPEDQFTNEFLKKVYRKKLINLLLQNIYNQRLTAYSYFDWIEHRHIAYSIDSVKKLIKSIGINRIGKIEFVERWYYDPQKNVFYKQVLEMTLGYERYTDNGQVKNYGPVFKISFDPRYNQNLAK